MTLGLTYSNTQRKMEALSIKTNFMKKITAFVLSLPTIFILSFLCMILTETMRLGSIPDFINEEQGFTLISEFVILLFYISVISIPIVIPIVTLQSKLKLQIKRNWIKTYYMSVAIILIYVLFNPFHLFTWFMG
jgi:hypothetical protein